MTEIKDQQNQEEIKSPEAGEGQKKKTAPPAKAILGRKVGMTRIFDEGGRVVPVTVLQAKDCYVAQVKTKEKEGYTSLQLALGHKKKKNVTNPLIGHYAKAEILPAAYLKEIRVDKVEGYESGQAMSVAYFQLGDMVDISGVNKGKGFAGTMKRHRFHGGPRTHGQSDRARAPGSSGGQLPQRVFKGVRGPGHMGGRWSTTQRLKVIHVDEGENLLVVKGSVPGPVGNFLTVQKTTRPKKIKSAGPVSGKKAAKAAKK